MIKEVERLRRLRRTALKMRALASSLNAGECDGGVHGRVARLHWRIARIATGQLRSHPYWNYQKDPGLLESAVDRCCAFVVARLALLRGQGLRVLLREMRSAARELDDTRALTWSADLSDALGRAQLSMRMLLDEVRGHDAVKSGHETQARIDAAASMSTASMSTSPYLAL